MAIEGSQGTFPIEGYGIAEILVKTRDGSVTRLRFPVTHMSTFSMNLLSLPAMDKQGYCAIWGNG